MKTNIFFKRSSTIIMAFAMLFSLFGTSNTTVTANAADLPVKMYYCDRVANWRGGTQYTVYIQVAANSAAQKAVYVHYDAGSNQWQDVAATYVTKLNSNTEIWKATVSGFAIGSKYAIKYIGDNTTYWDNNNGNDYLITDILGQANVIVTRLQYQTSSNYKINAVVKDLAYNKVVTVKYTQDNWATCQEAALSYSSDYINNSNYENWTVTLNLNENKMDSFHYYVTYQVNGQTYIDNNFGANYNTSHYLPLGS